MGGGEQLEGGAEETHEGEEALIYYLSGVSGVPRRE